MHLAWLSANLNFLWRCSPTRAMASSFMRFLDRTQRHTTFGRTPLDEWSARRTNLYLTTHNTHNRQTSIGPLWTSDQLVAQTSTWQHTTLTTDIHRTRLDEWSARRTNLYLTTHNTHKRQTSIRLLWTSDQLVAETSTWQHNTQNRQTSIGLLWTSDQLVAHTSTCTAHNTHNRQTSIGLLWTSDRSDAETSTCTTQNTHNRQTSMPPAGLEPTTSARKRPQTYTLDRAATGTGYLNKTYGSKIFRRHIAGLIFEELRSFRIFEFVINIKHSKYLFVIFWN